MIRISIDKIVPTSDSLKFGCRVEYGDGGPIRFVQASIDDDVLDWATLSDMAAWITRQVERHLDRERELEEDLTLPGM